MASTAPYVFNDADRASPPTVHRFKRRRGFAVVVEEPRTDEEDDGAPDASESTGRTRQTRRSVALRCDHMLSEYADTGAIPQKYAPSERHEWVDAMSVAGGFRYTGWVCRDDRDAQGSSESLELSHGVLTLDTSTGARSQ